VELKIRTHGLAMDMASGVMDHFQAESSALLRTKEVRSTIFGPIWGYGAHGHCTFTSTAAPRSGVLGMGNRHRLLAPPSASAHIIYHHRTRAGVRNYQHGHGHRGAALPTAHITPPRPPPASSERTRGTRPQQPEHGFSPPDRFAHNSPSTAVHRQLADLYKTSKLPF
jgi:hypothetical protein